MARVFITGSADGLGLMTGRLLAQQGHAVVLHARNEQRAADTRAALPEAEAVVTGDLSTLTEMRHVADQASTSGRFDAVVHNVGMHLGGDPGLRDVQWEKRRWIASQAYSDTKLHDLLLTFGVARRWPDVPSNAVSPGWVPTRMGGPGAPDDLDQGCRTQVWLAVDNDQAARETGRYLYHQRPADEHLAVRDADLQDRLFDYCRDVSGIDLKP
jgi:NAD(P)-dependent dehydrogenase (short-subunit alcohol dehydrogenase family)